MDEVDTHGGVPVTRSVEGGGDIHLFYRAMAVPPDTNGAPLVTATRTDGGNFPLASVTVHGRGHYTRYKTRTRIV